MMKIQDLKYVDKVEWTYMHALNSVARTPITKTGVVVGIGKIFVTVHFEGNKNKSRTAPVEELSGTSAVCSLQTALGLRPRRALSSAEAP